MTKLEDMTRQGMSLNDQDLMSRLYHVGDFHLIDECLYLQRMHPLNTQRDQGTNSFNQAETVELYNRYIEANALAWARRRGLLALDLGDLPGADGPAVSCAHAGS